MPRQLTVIVLAGVALILGANAAQANPPPTCVELGGTCDQHRRCCGENLKCDLSITFGVYECKEKAKLGDSCREAIHCTDIVHSVCSKNKCVCRQSNVRVSDYACAPVLNGYCWKNETCMTENSLCVDNECRCRAGFLAEDNKCLPVVIGSKCSDDAACASVKFAECSSNKVCVCSDNAIEINERLCLVRLEQTCQADNDCAVPNSWCIDDKCQCKVQHFAYSEMECRLTFIGMPCDAAKDCHDHISNSYCYDDTCQCKRNFLMRNGNTCLPVTISYCSTIDDCLDTESVCINNRCQCKTNYVMRDSKCLPKQLMGRCSKNSHCSEVKFTMCLNGQCRCIDKFFAVNATVCTRGIGGSCSTDKDCTVEFSNCFQETCQCNQGYIQYSDSQCVALELGTTCFDKSTCNLIKNAHCLEDQCTCKDEYVETDASTCAPLLNAVCSDDLKCAPANSVCIDHRCQCEFSYFPKSNLECVLMYLERRCRIDKDCIDTRFAKCSDAGKCICHEKYVRTGPITCSPILGGYCTNNSECVTVNAECSRNRCHCSAEYMQRSDNLCLLVFLGQTCVMNNDCNKILHAECFNQKCQCRRGYTKFDQQKCLPLIGASCTEHKECAVYNSNCVDNKCQCLETYIPQTESECVSTSVGVACYSDDDCDIPNTHCSRFQFCICNKNFITTDNKACVTILGAYCTIDATCGTANSGCIDNKCQCREGFARGPYNDCVSVTLGGACATNRDCKYIPNAICIDNKCVCKPDTFALTPSACTHLLNTTCSSSADCGVKESHCFQNKCQCRPDWVAMTNTMCAKRSMLYYCDDGIDCGEPWHSKCSQNRCVCKENHLAVNELSCLPTLGGACWRDDQCMTANSLCIDYKCRCKPDFISVAVNMCVAR